LSRFSLALQRRGGTILVEQALVPERYPLKLCAALPSKQSEKWTMQRLLLACRRARSSRYDERGLHTGH
jgi:hypothetical protein